MPFKKSLTVSRLFRFAFGASLALAISVSASAEVQTRAYYHFAENSGLEVGDLAPETLQSQWSGPEIKRQGDVRVSDQVAPLAKEYCGITQSFSFDGKSGYKAVSAPTRASNNLGIEAWVRSTNVATEIILDIGDSAGYGLIRTPKGLTAVVNGKRIIGLAPLKLNEWTHVAFVVDDGNGTLYVNGKSAGSGGFSPWGPKNAMTIGYKKAKHPQHFNGDIAAVRVFEFLPGKFKKEDLLYFSAPRPPMPQEEFDKLVKAAAMPSFDEGTIGIVFEKEPVAKGMSFQRKGATPTMENGKIAWAAHSPVGGMPWMRQLNIFVDDPAFQNGKMPFVDVELEYRLNAWGNVEVHADTAAGSRKVGNGWGGSEKWKKLKFRIKDAYFGRRKYEGKGLNSSGADLRIFGATKAPDIRSIKITGYDRVDDVDWSQLLEIGNASHPDREILVYQPGDTEEVNYEISNYALVPKPLDYRFVIKNYDDGIMAAGSGSLMAAADSKTQLTIPMDASDWPLGGYQLALTLIDSEGGSIIKSIDSLIGFANGEEMEKARPGGFLYGIQKVKSPTKGKDAEWLEFLGVDNLRAHGGASDWKILLRDAPILAEQGISIMGIVDTPEPGNFMTYKPEGFKPGEREKEIAKLAKRLTPIAAEMKDYVTYWELDNEPDLRAFYSGPVEEYIASYFTIRDAIKAGNPDAVVMNGGLCYFGEIGDRRARKIIEALAPDEVDAWAYHAHGIGAAAEREALERIRDNVAEYGEVNKPFVQTESGVAAHHPNQFMMQAYTCVQKFVYAQSENIPVFSWFALTFGGPDGAYTSVERGREPRPVALAYRTTAQELRHHTFKELIETADSSVELYVFDDDDSNRRVVVAWISEPRVRTLYLDLAESAADIANLQVVDMFGNHTPVKPLEKGIAEFTISENPIFITWDAADPDFRIEEIPSPLEAPDPIMTAAGFSLDIPVVLRNLGQSEGTFSIETNITADRNVEVVAPDSITVSAGGSKEASILVSDTLRSEFISWPIAWRVFAEQGDKFANIDVSNIREIPDRLSGVDGQWVVTQDGDIDIGSIAGGYAKKDAAIAFAMVNSPVEQEVEIGASADWWMAWYVNGKEIYSTLARGNKGPVEITTHRFPIKLRKGSNIVAARVLSGISSWKLTSGGPAEVAAALNPALPPQRIELLLNDSSGKTLARQISPLVAMRELQTYENHGQELPSDIPPSAGVESVEVVNFHEKHPDSTRWWSGDMDLSAMVWCYRTDDKLRVVVVVKDAEIKSGGDEGDALSVSISPYGSLNADSLLLGSDGQLSQIEGTVKPMAATATKTADGVMYSLTWNYDDIPAGPNTISVTVQDNDAGFIKQEARIAIDRVFPKEM